jgi:integrase
MQKSLVSSTQPAAPNVAKPAPTPAANNGRFTSENRPKRYFDAGPCEGPGCTNIVPAGYYPAQRVRSFCSIRCSNREAASRYLVGTCQHCGGPVMGHRGDVGVKQFCCNEHKLAYETEQILGPTGPFRSLIEEYMSSAAPNYYRPGTLPTVRVSLAKVFRFAAQVEKITDLEEVRPALITRFIAHERERGLTSRSFVGHMSTFFRWAIAEERYTRANPVVSRIHSQRGAPAEARPYSDSDMEIIWATIERTGRVELMLAFALGEECGLRVGEVGNLRLSDIDQAAQTVFVRLPTKNMRTRTVPYHGKVRKYLKLWVEKRDPRCEHDHLLHNTALNPFRWSHLDAWFKRYLRNEQEPSASFNFHRLRHTWATRLMNNGMELAVLRELGGWEKWNSMQRYIRVLDSTVRSQYEAAYARLQERAESDDDEVISLVDFAFMDTTNAATPATPAA